MNSLHLFAVTVAAASLAAPLASAAAPADHSAAACMAPPSLSLIQRRVDDEAARGLPSLISFVNRTQPIYQLRLVDAVAMIDAERERRSACITASASARAD